MGNILRCCEEDDEEDYGSLLQATTSSNSSSSTGVKRDFKKRPLLWGCHSIEEEKVEIERILENVIGRHGSDGLCAAGFEYRLEACLKHAVMKQQQEEEEEEDVSCEEKKLAISEEEEDYEDKEKKMNNREHCCECCTRLYHINSNTRIESHNRSLFISDGVMYDEVCRVCQEVAQEVMQKEANLHWVTLCDDKQHKHPLRALVQHDHFHHHTHHHHLYPHKCQKKPTLLIATGKGKVSAGIFSRKHLLTSGIEPSTALPMIREAKKRGMRCALIDPNARGNAHSMHTFQKSLSTLFDDNDDNDNHHSSPTASSMNPPQSQTQQQQQQPPDSSSSQTNHNNDKQSSNNNNNNNNDTKNPMYILAHSASGGFLIRHLLTSLHLLPRIKAIAFTDSTHNIQWTKDHPHLHSKLQDKSSLYVRSNSVRSISGEEAHKESGEDAEGDHFWKHRFGSIKTKWAGTSEHSLMHWFSHHQIWSHFDEHHHPHESNSSSKS